MDEVDRDGYSVLPGKLSLAQIETLVNAIDRIAAAQRATNPGMTGVKVHNCVDADPAFRRLMMYVPALQLSYDAFGPMFHLNQSNMVSRPADSSKALDFLSGAPWHADGPRPRLFPAVDGRMGLHYLKFGYFLTDLTHGNGGSLQVVRGSHRRAELDGNTQAFDINDYASDLVQFDVEAGSMVVFHQALWHAAPPNESAIERKNVYISYCPTWMRPLDRELPTDHDLVGLSPEERWLLGEPRPAMRWWLPTAEDADRMVRYRRDSEPSKVPALNYD